MQADIVLFDDFETLDVFGPAEIFGRSPHYTLNYCSLSGGVITSSQGAQIITTVFEPEKTALMLVPGGQGTRRLVSDEGMLAALRTAAQHAQWCLSVCTGSALLAAAGVLDGRQATSNKRAWQWVTSVRTGKLGEKSTLVCGRPFLYLFRCIGGHGYGAGIYC